MNAASAAAAPVAIMTRCADAIGRATALRLSKGGTRLVLCDAREGELAALERALREAGADAVTLPLDAVTEDAARTMTDTALAAFGRVDVLVNGLAADGASHCAGWPAPASAADSALRRCLAAVRGAVPGLAASGSGAIVNVVSSAGRYRSAWFHYRGREDSAADTAGVDGGILALTRELAFELAPRRIRVNAVTVGWLRTPDCDVAWERLTARDQALVLEEISLRRRGEPDEVAAVIGFLASAGSSYVTGATIDVNGGWWMS